MYLFGYFSLCLDISLSSHTFPQWNPDLWVGCMWLMWPCSSRRIQGPSVHLPSSLIFHWSLPQSDCLGYFLELWLLGCHQNCPWVFLRCLQLKFKWWCYLRFVLLVPGYVGHLPRCHTLPEVWLGFSIGPLARCSLFQIFTVVLLCPYHSDLFWQIHHPAS